jgi:hypothetical protein
MLVGGGAVSEKEAAPETYDFTMTRPRDPAWRPGPVAGEAITRNLGWVHLLRQWVAMSANAGQGAVNDAVRIGGPDTPTNRELSRAMAFLFDMPDPVAVH